MNQIKFKGIDRSDFIIQAVEERMQILRSKFEGLKRARVHVTLESLNSPQQPGPDLYTVKIHVLSGPYKGFTLSRSEANIYVALAEVADHSLEKLSRANERKKTNRRSRLLGLRRIFSWREA